MTTEKIDLLLNQLNNADASAVVDIIKTITEMPGLFVFGELLDHPSIQALQNTQQHMFYELLELFCYGSFKSLQSYAHKFPELSPSQMRKLKQLTIIDEAHTSRSIAYDVLLHKLQLTSHRELEDLIIDLFYLGALSGKLDQEKAILEVESAIGRDIRANEVPELNGALDIWLTRIQSVLQNMATEIKLANTRLSETEQEQKKVKEASANMKEAMRIQADTQHMESIDAFHNVCDFMMHGGRGGFNPADKDLRNRMSLYKNLRRK